MDLFGWWRGADSPTAPPRRDPSVPVVRRCCRFSGLVQDVGFRWEAKMLAGRLGLTGWARNESDGTVTVELEGPEGSLGEFLRKIQEVPRFDITDIQTEELPPRGDERTFEIRY